MFVRVRLRASADPRAGRVPLLGIANHSSWWDGYLGLVVARHYGLPRFLMMEEAQLRRYPFFAWAGAFSVDRADPREVARGIAYAATLLAEQQSALVWVFPQAEIVPLDALPVVIHPGAAHILRRAVVGGPVGLLPVAWALVFRGEQHPEAFVRVGAVEVFDAAGARDVSSVVSRMQCLLTREMDALRDDLRTGNVGEYRTVLRGTRGANDRFDRLLRRDRLVHEP